MQDTSSKTTLLAFSEANINLAPESHGVYALYDAIGIIYIGRAAGQGVTIRSRLARHKSGAEGACTKSATAFWFEATPNAVGRERELLQWYRNTYRALPRCNELMP
jgi:hypothetical protein